MNLHNFIIMMLVAVIVFALVGALRRILFWKRGQQAQASLWGLLTAPKRFFVDVHHVVARDRYMANTHAATAGGFVVSAMLLVLVYAFNVKPSGLIWALLLSLALMMVGTLFVIFRRIGKMPAKLSRGAWNRLPISLLCFSGGFLILTLPATGLLPGFVWQGAALVLLLSMVAWGVCELILGMTWGGPMKHAFAGFIHLGLHPRPERFNGDPLATALKPIDLEMKKLGVEKTTDFKWNQLLGFDACVQCGRCQEVCPAYAAGQPLNPKKVIQDLVVGLADQQNDKQYAGRGYPGVEVGLAQGNSSTPITPNLINPDTLWSCTTCRACVYECPMMIEHVDAIVDMRRYLTLEKGATPVKGAELLEELAATDNPGGIDPDRRSHWAADLNVPLLSEVGRTEVLLWQGDGAFEMRNQKTLRSVVKLLQKTGVDFAILGNEELDCGDTARRLGDEATYQDLARRNIEILNKYSFDCIVTTDPHALQALKNEYKAFGGDYTVLHHTTYFAAQINQEKLTITNKAKQKITYHDPCYLGRYNGEIEAPRSILESIAVDVVEMERSGMRSRCCGGGGGAAVTDIPGEQRMPDIRIEDARQTKAEVVAVGCPQCTMMFEGVIEPRPAIKDIAELLMDAVE